MPDRTHCGQPNCGAEVVWGRTVRHLDEKTKRMTGGRPMMVDWPLPVLRMEHGRLLAGEDGQPVPNLGVRQDQWGTLIVRVLTDAEPLRADERPGVPHWATCKNPPKRDRPKRRTRPKASPGAGQDTLDLGHGAAGNVPADRASGVLSDESLFPRRRPRRA